MKHRHLTEKAGYSVAAVADILGRGGEEDWRALGASLASQRSKSLRCIGGVVARVGQENIGFHTCSEGVKPPWDGPGCMPSPTL